MSILAAAKLLGPIANLLFVAHAHANAYAEKRIQALKPRWKAPTCSREPTRGAAMAAFAKRVGDGGSPTGSSAICPYLIPVQQPS